MVKAVKGKRIAAIVGAGAATLMVAVPVAVNSPDVAQAANPQPVARMGSTQTWEAPTTTTPPTAPATEKAVPTVKAPHK